MVAIIAMVMAIAVAIVVVAAVFAAAAAVLAVAPFVVVAGAAVVVVVGDALRRFQGVRLRCAGAGPAWSAAVLAWATALASRGGAARRLAATACPEPLAKWSMFQAWRTGHRGRREGEGGERDGGD